MKDFFKAIKWKMLFVNKEVDRLESLPQQVIALCLSHGESTHS